jgi:hypothetical protein
MKLNELYREHDGREKEHALDCSEGGGTADEQQAPAFYGSCQGCHGRCRETEDTEEHTERGPEAMKPTTYDPGAGHYEVRNPGKQPNQHNQPAVPIVPSRLCGCDEHEQDADRRQYVAGEDDERPFQQGACSIMRFCDA